LRMGVSLMRTSQVYLPYWLRNADVPLKERADYYLKTWPKWREKWLKLGALKFAFEKSRPMGQWRQVVQELYDIKLKL